MPYPDVQRRSRRGRLVYGGGTSSGQRYFRELLASANSFYTSASVSPDTIEMDVYPINGNAGLPTGSPAVTDNQWQTISFAFTGSISEWGRNGAVYFDGIIANIRPLSSGVDLFSGEGALDGSNSTGTDGALTLNNFATPQVVLYDQVSDGWTGPELLTFTPSTYINAEETVIDVGGEAGTHLIKSPTNTLTGVVWSGVAVAGVIYRASLNVTESNNGALNMRGLTGPISAIGVAVNDIQIPATSYYVRRQGGFASVDITSKDHSLKRFLEVV